VNEFFVTSQSTDEASAESPWNVARRAIPLSKVARAFAGDRKFEVNFSMLLPQAAPNCAAKYHFGSLADQEKEKNAGGSL